MINRTNLLLDFGILGAFLLVMEPGLTGLAVHEWLALAFFGAILVHLLLHWKWITQVTLQFFRKLFHTSRLQYGVDVALLISFTAAMLSGLLISRVALPALNLSLFLGRNFAWTRLHAASATSTLLLIALHFALHWDWVVTMTRRYLINPLRGLFSRRGRTPAESQGRPAVVPVEVERR